MLWGGASASFRGILADNVCFYGFLISPFLRFLLDLMRDIQYYGEHVDRDRRQLCGSLQELSSGPMQGLGLVV